jgi:DNA-binding SARP family transcriptional activator
MALIRVLGAPDARDDGGTPLAALNSQPKRLLLLAFLAVGRPDGCRRDTLLGLFWPELPEDRARNALRQALAVLRSELGAEAIVGQRGEGVTVNHQLVTTDAARFSELIAAGAHEEGLALYRGDFLEGVFLTDCEELERWVEDERAHYRHVAAAAARAGSKAAEQQSRADDAATLAARAVTIAPYEEALWRDRIALLGRLGRRAEAVQCLEELRKRLADDLGVPPDPLTEAVAARIRESREVPAVPVSAGIVPPPAASPAPPPAAESEPGTSAGPAKRRRPRLRRWGSIAVGLAAVAVAAWPRPRRDPPRVDPGLVAVQPLTVRASDTTLQVFGGALAELIALRFTGEGGPRSVDPTAVMVAWRRDSAASLAATLERARSLGAGLVLRATLVQSGAHVILSGGVYEVPDGSARADGAAEGPADSLLAIADRFVGQLMGRQQQTGEAFLQDLVTHSPTALRAYLAGQTEYRRGRFGAAGEHFREALERDSTFALAAIQLFMSGVWGGPGAGNAVAIAKANRNRLPPALRAAVDVFANDPMGSWSRDYPRWEAAARTLPSEPFVWQRLGDQLYHTGGFLDAEPAARRSLEAFHRAYQLDSTQVVPLIHLTDWAARRGDSAEVTRLARRYLSFDSVGEKADYMRWRLATSGAGRHPAIDWGRMARPSLGEILGTSVLDGIGIEALDQIEATALSIIRSASDPGMKDGWLPQLYFVELTRGHADRAASLAAELRAVPHPPPPAGGADDDAMTNYVEVMSAVYAGADPRAAARAARALSAAAESLPRGRPGGRMMQGYAVGALAIRAASEGDRAAASRWVGRAREIDHWTMPPLGHSTIETSIAITEAMLGDAAPRRRLDSLLREGPVGNVVSEAAAALTLSDRLAASGDLAGARRALSRRRYFQPLPVYTAAFLERETRLATATGDHLSAARAARHLRALRGG